MTHILITGVSTGIGRACALKFAAEGWKVTGTVRDPDRVEEQDRLPGVELERLDLAVPGSAASLGARVIEASGCPDVLLNNAGMLQFGPIEEYCQPELERIFQVNVFGQLELIRALVPAMRERGSGVIANVTSLGGRMVFPFFAAYNSTKWALEGASEGLWHELRPFGVRVKAIEPGFVETAIWDKVLPAEAGALIATDVYRPYLASMMEFEKTITDRTPPDEAAVEVFRAVTDDSDRLRYPIAAYAKSLTASRRAVGDQAMMRFFHTRWMGQPDGDDRL